MKKYGIAIIGLGKIAQDQHLPAIKANDAFEIRAVSSQRDLPVMGAYPVFRGHGELLEQASDVDAVVICTPPQVRHRIAYDALLAGKHVMLEKPPAASLSELADLKRVAEEQGKVLFTTWHSQYNAAVLETKKILTGKKISRMFISWKEDVRKWHPGQQWIWEPGGFGVFDPGINALSIVTWIMPEPVFIQRSDLFFPSNRDAPIAANLEFTARTSRVDLRAEFDWRQADHETWEITLETADGLVLKLSKGGARLEIDGKPVVDEIPAEYGLIYKRFDSLLSQGRSEIDERPFQLVADAYLVGRRIVVEPFEE